MDPEKKPLPVIVAVTGASGAVYGLTLARMILARGIPLYLLFTDASRAVVLEETGRPVEKWIAEFRAGAHGELLVTPDARDFSCSIASGSFRTAGMIVAPCSMGTLGRIAAGLSNNLLERAADVCLKEARTLILLARETPLSAIHLENMLRLARANAVVMPPVPAFYAKPATIEELVANTCDRVLDRFGLPNADMFRWQQQK